MRNIYDVLKAILDEVPSEAVGLRRDLVKLYDSCGYTPPEMAARDWNNGAYILARHCGDTPHPEGSWQKVVQDIWCGRVPVASSKEV